MAVSSISSSSAFNVDGILSGLSTSDLIDQLSSAEKNAILQLQRQKAKVAARDTAYQELNTRAVTFQAALKTLLFSSSISGRAAIATAPTIATASASADAANGVFTVNVLGQATATTIVSGSGIGRVATADGFGNVDSAVLLKDAGLTIPVTAGTFTINGHAITVDPLTQTWAQVKTAIETATSGAATLTFANNKVSLVSTGNPMQVGAPADTSTFLSATHLLGAAQVGSAGTYTVTSNQLLGGALTTVPLSTANLAIGGGILDNGGTGSFNVNGATINWTVNDSLNSVLGRINASSANVRATYDSTTDRISLYNLISGAQDVALSDTSGNFLAALQVTAGGVKTVGSPAQYTITQNGVTTATQYSNTNVVTNALPGITLTLAAIGSSAVTVSQDTASATRNVQAFVDQFNALTELIAKHTAIDPVTKGASVLSGEAGVRMLDSQLRSLVSSRAVAGADAAYKTLADVGITTGAFGATLGSTRKLTLDPAKFTARLATNPNAVFDVMSGLTSTLVMAAGASNPWAAGATGAGFGVVKSGSYLITHDGSGGLSSVFTPTGGAGQAATIGTITASGSNSTLIPGINLTALGILPALAGSHTFNFTVTGRGVLQGLNGYLGSVLGITGLFGTEQSGASAQQRSLDARIDVATDRLAKRQMDLQKRFTAMEQALARLQNQSSALLSQLNNNNN